MYVFFLSWWCLLWKAKLLLHVHSIEMCLVCMYMILFSIMLQPWLNFVCIYKDSSLTVTKNIHLDKSEVNFLFGCMYIYFGLEIVIQNIFVGIETFLGVTFFSAFLNIRCQSNVIKLKVMVLERNTDLPGSLSLSIAVGLQSLQTFFVSIGDVCGFETLLWKISDIRTWWVNPSSYCVKKKRQVTKQKISKFMEDG